MIYSEREEGGFSQVTVTAANLDCRLMIDTRAAGIPRPRRGGPFPTEATSILAITH